jgi:hypothetical protein
MIDRWTNRSRVCVGDMRNSDDPRGREFSAEILVGVPTGEFDDHYWQQVHSNTFSAPQKREYGSWGVTFLFWYWGLCITVRGPIIGKYPPSEDDE